MGEVLNSSIVGLQYGVNRTIMPRLEQFEAYGRTQMIALPHVHLAVHWPELQSR